MRQFTTEKDLSMICKTSKILLAIPILSVQNSASCELLPLGDSDVRPADCGIFLIHRI